MIDYIFNLLRSYPVLALFLTVGVGFFIGRLRIGSFSLGSVTSVLLVGVVVGQLDISIAGPIKQFFFMLFLFSIGYSVGPEFFKSLRGSGLKQVLFAVLMSSMCFGITFLMSKLLGYSKGETVGLFSGSETCSALLGVGAETISRLGLPADVLKRELDIIPVCYAVTYIFGTLGTVILIGNFGPRILGGTDKVRMQTKELEKKLHASVNDNDPAVVNALNNVVYRSYIVDYEFFNTPRTRHEAEMYFRENGMQVYVDRLSHDDDVTIKAPRYEDMIYKGDRVVVCGRKEYMVDVEKVLGREIADEKLQSYSLDRLPVLVTKKDFIGIPLHRLRLKEFMHGVVVRDAERSGKPMLIDGDTEFRKGDMITVVGQSAKVKRASENIGHADRPSIQSDLMFVGLAIFIGGFFGVLSIWVGSIPVSFGTSGGSLVAGLVFGWLRSKRPTWGYISPGALWIMNNLGLNVFVGVVGIEAAPSFIAGIKAVGPMLLLAGAVGTLVPLLFGLFIGHKLFKFNPAITLGCCCGTRTCTAALGAVQDNLGSTLPAIGYTVTYAVSNILLVIWGMLTVYLV